MARSRFEVGACTDLGAYDRDAPDAGASAFVEQSDGLVDWLVIMEDRQPEFFHGYDGFTPDAHVPLNRHGPSTDAWSHADLKRLVDGLRDLGVRVFLGYWAHECDWVDVRHPELLLHAQSGSPWQDAHAQNADFNPMRRLRADPESGVEEGETYAAWAVRRFNRIADDFGFDGLFLGDGAMGFRRHGEDHRDLRFFDYHPEWLAEFCDSRHATTHAECALHDADASTAARARDIRIHHWPEWVEWNCGKWTGYYAETASGVHAAGRELAAYNVMNYDPALARLHGVDYRGIANAGLDKLIFQAYDYAWGPDGPFSWLGIRRKDHATNLKSMLLARAHMTFDVATKLLFTTETDDSIEHWDAPRAHTLGEAFSLGSAVAYDGERWRRAADGTFIVWANAVERDEWLGLAGAYHVLETPPEAPHAALVWRDGDERGLVADALDVVTPEERYAHLDGWPQAHDGPAPAVVRESDVTTAAWRERPTRVRVFGVDALEGPPRAARAAPTPRAARGPDRVRE